MCPGKRYFSPCLQLVLWLVGSVDSLSQDQVKSAMFPGFTTSFHAKLRTLPRLASRREITQAMLKAN
jgi:hypothetical protein